MFRNFINNEDGQGMVEYGLIIALIAIVVIAALTGLGGKVNDIFEKASGALDSTSSNNTQQ